MLNNSAYSFPCRDKTIQRITPAITPADAAATEQIFETLLGDDLPARKEFIAVHGSEYIKDADI